MRERCPAQGKGAEADRASGDGDGSHHRRSEWLPLYQYWAADRSEIIVARWVGSKETSSSRDTVAVPAFEFSRRIGPMVQDCRLDLVQYRHAPGGKPKYEVLNLVVGTTCTDIIVLDDPPRERIPLAAIGFLLALVGLVMLYKARQAVE